MTDINKMNNEEIETNVVNLVNLRWGYDGGGMACGPVEGSTITETTWIDQFGKIFFVSVSRMMEYANVYVSDTSLFDLLLYMTRSDVDTESVIDQVDDNAKEIYEMTLTDLSDYEESENKEMIEITLMANDQYCRMDESASAEEWLNDYNAGRIEPDWVSDFIDEERREDDEEDEKGEIEELNLIPDADDLTPEQLEARINELASKVKEISRRSYYHEEGFECGPAASTEIAAEIVAEVNDQKVYLNGYWTDIVDAYDFCATKECLYDYYEAMNSAPSDEMKSIIADEVNRISSERMRDYIIIFKPLFVELKKMIHGEMKAHGLEYFYEDQAEDDDEVLM